MTPDLIDADAVASAGKTGCLIVPSHDTGHATYEWDKADPADVAEARKIFAEKKKLGYVAYRVDPKSGDKGAVIKDFDPEAGKVVLLPPFAGG